MVNLGGSRSIARMACITLVLAFVSCQTVESFDDPRTWNDVGVVDEGGAPALRPQVALDGEGHAIVVWDQTDRRYPASSENSDDIWWARTNASLEDDWFGWATPSRLDDDFLNEPCDSVGPQIAVGGDDSVIVVFAQDASATTSPNECVEEFSIWAVRRTPDGVWGRPECIQDVAGCLGAGGLALGRDASNPQLAMDSEGNALVVWQVSNVEAQTAKLWRNRYVAGRGWNSPLEFFDLPPISQRPQVAMDANGDALIVWEQVDDTGYSSVSARWVRAQGDVESPEPLERFQDGHALDPQVAVNAAGEAIAVWKQQRTEDGLFEIWANHYDPASAEGWAGAEALDSGPDGNAERPQVAINDAGDAVAVWTIAGFRGRVWSNRYQVHGGWRVATPIGPLGLGSARLPQVAVNHAGWAVAVWVQFDGAKDNIWSSRYIPGQGWVSRGPVVEHEEVHGTGPQLVLDLEGNALVAWINGPYPHSDIYSARLFTQPLEVPE